MNDNPLVSHAYEWSIIWIFRSIAFRKHVYWVIRKYDDSQGDDDNDRCFTATFVHMVD